MSVAGLLLGDSRFPAGGHAHSGGVEPAVTAGTVRDLATLEAFLRGRLRTAGLVAAGIAAAACEHARSRPQITKYPEFRAAGFAAEIPDGTGGPGSTGNASETGLAGDAGTTLASSRRIGGQGAAAEPVPEDYWSLLDSEVDARTPSPAQREASRRQGRALLRAARTAWPDAAGLAELAASARAGGADASRGARTRSEARAADISETAAYPGSGAHAAGTVGGRRVSQGTADRRASGDRRSVAARPEYRGGPHHAVVLGAAAAAAGAQPGEAARIAAYQAVAGPVSAAVRLLALDPMRATGVLARLAGEIDQVAALGAAHGDGPLSDLPCASAPALDLFAEAHIRAEVRLFES